MQKKQKPATRSRFYTDVGTKGWRQTGYDTYGFYSPGFRQWIGSQFPAKKKMILSVGCGTGELEKHLSELRHTVVGLDLSHPMLKRASRHGLDLLVQADAYSLPFRAAQFDVMMLMESIGYLEPAKVFAEARRVLRKRGRLMITTYAAPVDAHARYRKWGMDEIANQLIDAGFRTDEQRYLAVKKISVREVASEDRSGLLYLSSTAMS
jgi:ubiquinone/menaquinone biosynthesis C-methylase UbiE